MSKKHKSCGCSTQLTRVESRSPARHPGEIEARAKKAYETAQLYSTMAYELPDLGKDSARAMFDSVRLDGFDVLFDGMDSDCPALYRIVRKLAPLFGERESATFLELSCRIRATPELLVMWNEYCFHFVNEEADCDCPHETKRIDLGIAVLKALDCSPEATRMTQLFN